METVGTADRTHASQKHAGILYPVMLIAAIVVIVFSVVGTATMMGWMPAVLSGGAADNATGASGAVRPLLAPAPFCDNCGVIESIRAIQIKREGKGMKSGSGVTYQIRVRMNDGTARTYYESALPALVIGQKVRVSERGILAGS